MNETAYYWIRKILEFKVPEEISVIVEDYERKVVRTGAQVSLLSEVNEPTKGWAHIIISYDHPELGYIYIINDKYRWGLFDDWEEAGAAFIRLTDIHNYYHKYNEQKKINL